jgi:hypothetical protein
MRHSASLGYDRAMQKLILALLLVALPVSARAETIGLGLFLGEPTGLDIKVGLGRRSSLDVVIGQSSFRDARTDYLHVTYLLTPFVARGRSVLVPLRIGIGGAAIGLIEDDGFEAGAVRMPFEIGFRFRSVPFEIYGEITLLGVFTDSDDEVIDFELDGGIGFRFYF